MLQMFDSDLTNQMKEWSDVKLIGISLPRQDLLLPPPKSWPLSELGF